MKPRGTSDVVCGSLGACGGTSARGGSIPWVEEDWREWEEEEQQRRMQAWWAEDRRRRFNVSRAPLVRMFPVRRGEAEVVAGVDTPSSAAGRLVGSTGGRGGVSAVRSRSEWRDGAAESAAAYADTSGGCRDRISGSGRIMATAVS